MNDAPATVLPLLADLLAEALDIVFVGINPSIYAASRGHYFARPTNRFWPCLSRSTLSGDARAGLGVRKLGPEHDAALLRYGIGFTDVVKRPTIRAAQVTPAEFAAGVSVLVEKLERYIRESLVSTASPAIVTCIACSVRRTRPSFSVFNLCASERRTCILFPIRAVQMRT